MRARQLALLVFLAGSTVKAADLGDINGDGRVSFGDAFLLAEWRETGNGEFRPVSGSDAFAPAIRCTTDVAELTFEEALRRASPVPSPHFIERWPDSSPNAPAPLADDRVQIEVLPIAHSGGAAEVDLQVKVTSRVPLGFLAILLRCEGLDLRPAPPPLRSPLIGSTEYSLLSGGLLAFHSTLTHPRTFDLERVFSLPCVLPRGTRPGSYAIEVLEGTEVVTASGELIRPAVVTETLVITDETTGGHILPFPPLELDPGARRVAGAAEVRVTRAEARPGEEATLKVQLRAERPVNWVEFSLRYDPVSVEVEEARPVYVDPELGRVVPEDNTALFLNWSVCTEDVGFLAYRYTPRPVDTALYEQSQEQPPLKYLAPLGEWIDLLEVRVRLLPEAQGKRTLPFEFIDTVMGGEGDLACYFLPYFPRHRGWHGCGDEAAYWDYETVWTPGGVDVPAGGDPVPPPGPPLDPQAADIRLQVGEAMVEARPGDLVKLPVSLVSGVPLWKVRLALGFDVSRLEFTAFEVNFNFDGNTVAVRLEPGNEGKKVAENLAQTVGPDGENVWQIGLFPFSAEVYGEPWESVPPGIALIDIATVYCWFYRTHGGLWSWDPQVRYDLGTLIFRVREEAAPGRTEIADREVDWKPYSFRGTRFFLRSSTQGYPLIDVQRPAWIYVPANLIVPGVITIVGQESRFLRGDSNGDGFMDLSDAVSTLHHLFLGAGALHCGDAADANDDGAVDIGDPIFSLEYLYLGGPAPPEPYPNLGRDPTADRLGCESP